MYERKIKEDLDCGIVAAMRVFGAKWKPCIIDAIGRGIKRPSELHRYLDTTSPRVIDMQLSELVDFGVVVKEVSPGFPLNVAYSLTPLGESILPVISALDHWGTRHKDQVKVLHERQLSRNRAKLVAG